MMDVAGFKLWHKIRVEIEENVIGTKVFVDGGLIQGLRFVKVEHRVGEYPIVTLEILPGKLELDGGCSQWSCTVASNPEGK